MVASQPLWRSTKPVSVARGVRVAALLIASVTSAVTTAAVAGQLQKKTSTAFEKTAPIGTRVPKGPDAIEGQRLNQFFDEMARCVVRRAPDRADYFLRRSDDFGTAEDVSDVTKFLPLPSCVIAAADMDASSSMARFSPRALRNWLSEKAYLAANESFAARDPVAGPVPERTYFTRTGLMKAQGYGKFSDCIVSVDAEHADALVRTVPGSPAERKAALDMVPAMSECLPPDLTLTFSQDIIRGLAAQGLWQSYEAHKPARYKAGR